MASVDGMNDVPIFLRKLFAMVNEADKAICSWHEDGVSFVIKDQKAFERIIIPQYFKHNKIASFVRQLNFYSFRKIQYNDSLRIDPELEKKTKNWWRFRHENFQRDHPNLLAYIKRTPNHAGKIQTATASTSRTRSPSPVSSISVPIEAISEVQSLKKKLAEMTKNIDELTHLVQKVSLKQEEHETVGNKRTKVYQDDSDEEEEDRPDVIMSHAEMEAIAALPLENVAWMPLPDPVSIGSSVAVHSDTSDDAFVDALFDAFAEEPEAMEFTSETSHQHHPHDHPDPELMRRLGDALMLLPKEIQEMIVDRLIAAIMNTDIVTSKTAVAAVEEEAHKFEATVQITEEDEDDEDDQEEERRPENTLPLAAATLAALLHHYSTEVAAKSHNQKHNKSIPVIPVHA